MMGSLLGGWSAPRDSTATAAVGMCGVLLACTGLCAPVMAQEVGPTGERLREAPERYQTPAVEVEPPADEAISPSQDDGLKLRISRIKVEYAFGERQGLPTLAEIGQLSFQFVRRPDGVIDSPRAAGEPLIVTIAEFSDPAAPVFTEYALVEIIEGIKGAIQDKGIIAFQIQPHEDQIDLSAGEDLREDDLGLTLVILVGSVGEVRTLSSGRRWGSEQNPVNVPKNERIRERSPLQAGDIISKAELDRYVLRLNRHPGRRVDVSIAQYELRTEAPEDESARGLLALDYLVAEDKPWTAYFQLQNTGTEQTDRWRERFGFAHYQLTNADDIFRLDYTTAGFESSHAVTASYERPLPNDRFRVRAFGTYDEYVASDVAVATQDFEGESWELGGELIFNLAQRGPTFFDLFAGFRGGSVSVDESLGGTLQQSASVDVAYPYVGLAVTRDKGTSHSLASASVEWQVADNSLEEISKLGRQSVDETWTAVHGELAHSFYLEPVLRRRAFRGEGLPASVAGDDIPWQRGMSLAHEVKLSIRGQYVLDDARTIPNDMLTAGGLYTVRGYPESSVAGDNGFVASAEYRFHLPRALRPVAPAESSPDAFRFRPDRAYGSADWDLVLSTFFDVGRVTQNDRQSFETDDTLMGAGAGIEMVLSRQLQASCRLDWGVALSPIRDSVGQTLTEVGDTELHFTFTLLF